MNQIARKTVQAPAEVADGLLPTAFHDRLAPFNRTQSWMGWSGYLSARRFGTVESEYFAIRNQSTLFDVSPMHKYRIRGPQALDVVNRLVTRNVAKMKDGRVGYSVWCDQDGQVIDDGTVFRFSATDFRLCCQAPQFSWLGDVAWGLEARVEDESDSVVGIALQGPTSASVLRRMGLDAVETLRPFDVVEAEAGLTLSRTGFTGDLGYELWCASGDALALFDRLAEAGREFGIRPIGYDAVEMARIEAGFLLPGVDFQSSHHALRPTRGRTPFELGLGRLVDFGKGHFNGRRALLKAQKDGPRHLLVGLEIEGHKPADGALVYKGRGRKEVGHVTSALWSPTCKRNLAIAEIAAEAENETLSVEIYHDKEGKWERVMARARIVPRPFFDNPRRSATPPAAF